MPAQDTTSFSHPHLQHAAMDSHFVAPDILRRSDVFARRAKLLRIVSSAVIPRLASLHDTAAERPPETRAEFARLRQGEIRFLAHLVLGDDLQATVDYLSSLRARGVSMDTLFVDVLEPAARYLGTLWDDDACDFIDVTLGVGRLQHLMAIFNETHALAAIGEKRQVLMTTMPDERHFFGAAMVEKFLSAGGWIVRSEPATAMETVATLVEDRWFAVVGLTLSCEEGLAGLQGFIDLIRRRSCNRAVGIMVGGPVFVADPDLAKRCGADATALTAPGAVLLAQTLFDRGAKTGWQ